jgi:hypothetical protein
VKAEVIPRKENVLADWESRLSPRLKQLVITSLHNAMQRRYFLH